MDTHAGGQHGTEGSSNEEQPEAREHPQGHAEIADAIRHAALDAKRLGLSLDETCRIAGAAYHDGTDEGVSSR